MLCQTCKQNPATVHVTEIKHEVAASSQNGSETPSPSIQQQHLCEQCAQAMKLPYGAAKSSVQDILKLIKAANPRTRPAGGLACPDCGITLVEFRQRGRLGCPKDYEVFGSQLRDLLERIHGASRHVGRAPTLDEAFKRMQRITELRAALDAAIRDEAYEAAAKLRDELRSLQS
jgi:protein arginine kinase activator